MQTIRFFSVHGDFIKSVNCIQKDSEKVIANQLKNWGAVEGKDILILR